MAKRKRTLWNVMALRRTVPRCGRRAVLFALAILHLAAPAQAQNESKVLLWRLQGSRGIDKADLGLLGGYLSTEIQNQTDLSVYTQADIATLLETESLKQSCGVEDASCIAEIGNALGARQAVAGEIGKIGTSWLVNLRRIDVQDVVVIKRVSKKIDGDFAAVIDLVPYVVAELFGDQIKQADKTHAILQIDSAPQGLGVKMDGKPDLTAVSKS